MAKKVNLDAFIPREDFEIQDDSRVGKKIEAFSLNDLRQDSFFFVALRKPDFQRETNEWDRQRICDLVKSFVEGDLIPAIILWKNASGYTFVIDGSHRISSLAAWINDDYGDGEISKLFYDGIIPDEQIGLAEKTRRLIRKEVGSYSDYKLALKHPEKVKSDIVDKSKHLGTLAIQLQWVEGDSTKAEQSFFKINQQAAPIDRTELKLLKSRKLPNGIAARAIIRSGTGHKYWAKFIDEAQSEIESIAKEINDILFQPRFKTPVRTLDLPIGGKISSSSSLPLILEFVNIVNNVKSEKSLPEDENGTETIKFLKYCRKIAFRINSNHPSSLGLHPIVYFYSRDGRHKIASFFAVTALILEFERKNLYKNFTKIRSNFEEILINNDNYIQQIVRHYRSAINAYIHIKDFFILIIEELLSGKSKEKVISVVLHNKKFKYLTTRTDERLQTESSDISGSTKSAVYIVNAIENALKCKICNGYLHSNAISFDHINRKEDGGLGTFDNVQLSHPYCNSSIKN